MSINVRGIYLKGDLYCMYSPTRFNVINFLQNGRVFRVLVKEERPYVGDTLKSSNLDDLECEEIEISLHVTYLFVMECCKDKQCLVKVSFFIEEMPI